MIVIAGLVIGLLFGATLAKRRKGKTKDLLQYAAAYAILFSIIGLFVTVIVHRIAI